MLRLLGVGGVMRVHLMLFCFGCLVSVGVWMLIVQHSLSPDSPTETHLPSIVEERRRPCETDVRRKRNEQQRLLRLSGKEALAKQMGSKGFKIATKLDKFHIQEDHTLTTSSKLTMILCLCIMMNTIKPAYLAYL